MTSTCRSASSRSNARVERLRVERAATSGSASRSPRKSRLLVPGAQGVSLHEPVRVVAREAGLDERQQDALAEDEAVRRVEVRAHALGVDDEPVDEPREAVEHVVEGEEGVGEDDALGARVRDVALVPERDVLEPDRRAAARTTRASPQIRSATTGLRLWGMADEPFWPRPNGSCTSRTSVRARWRISVAKRSSEAAHKASAERSSAWRSRGTTWVAAGSRLEPEPLAGDPLDLGIAAAVVADRARRACRPRMPSSARRETLAVAVELERPARRASRRT